MQTQQKTSNELIATDSTIPKLHC